MRKKQLIQGGVLLAAAAVALLVTIRFQTATYTIQIPDALDTVSEITVTTDQNGNVILKECEEYIREMDRLFSPTNPESDVCKINSAVGAGTTVPVDARTADILSRAQQYSVETSGFFDVTVGSIMNIWDEAQETGTLPTPESISEAIHDVGFRNFEVNRNDNTVTLYKQHVDITLGGIAKGYITDGLVAMLREKGVSSALINLGGNTYALGEKAERTPWNIGIQDPNDPERLIGNVQVENQCVITSGDYQRYFELDGVRYHHIMNPNTGMPSRSGLRSVTIIGEDATLADALSTACFVLGYSEGSHLISQYPGVMAVFVTDTNTVYYSGALEDVFERSNQNYEYRRF